MAENMQSNFFYWIHYPSTEPHDCWWENDIECISRSRQTVEMAWKQKEEEYEEELSKRDNRIDEFKSDVAITGDKVWIIFSYDAEDPDWACIKFIGNSIEECMAWWAENWTDYIDHDPEEGEEAPEWDTRFGYRWGHRGYGLRIEEKKIA